MKVVFVQEVLGTAIPGEVRDVKPGFARNYLFPRNLAVPATKDALQRAEVISKKEERRQAHLDNDARALVAKLEGQTLTIRARAGDQGRLYGSVTTSEIADRLTDLLGEEFDRRRVLLKEPIRQIGAYTVSLRLTRNIIHTLPIEVESEDARNRRVSAEPLPPIIPDEPDLPEDDDDEEDE